MHACLAGAAAGGVDGEPTSNAPPAPAAVKHWVGIAEMWPSIGDAFAVPRARVAARSAGCVAASINSNGDSPLFMPR
jgi:hypothetical protein